MSDFKVVVCGGGIAAVEGVLRLRKLAGDAVDIQLVAPNEELVLRPLAVRQPFAFGPPHRYPLKRIAADTGADWSRTRSAGWTPKRGRCTPATARRSRSTRSLVAVGARQVEPYPHVRTFSDARADETFQGVVQDIEEGYSRERRVPACPTGRCIRCRSTSSR